MCWFTSITIHITEEVFNNTNGFLPCALTWPCYTRGGGDPSIRFCVRCRNHFPSLFICLQMTQTDLQSHINLYSETVSLLHLHLHLLVLSLSRSANTSTITQRYYDCWQPPCTLAANQNKVLKEEEGSEILLIFIYLRLSEPSWIIWPVCIKGYV